jgi:hypothetical protein
MEVTKMETARKWAMLRELWLQVFEFDCNQHSLLASIASIIRQYPPNYVPRVGLKNSGDQGYIEFDDGSKILWDWDNGNLDYSCTGTDSRGDVFDASLNLRYPYSNDDPLFWVYQTHD